MSQGVFTLSEKNSRTDLQFKMKPCGLKLTMQTKSWWRYTKEEEVRGMWAGLVSFPLFQNGHANNIWTTSVKKLLLLFSLKVLQQIQDNVLSWGNSWSLKKSWIFAQHPSVKNAKKYQCLCVGVYIFEVVFLQQYLCKTTFLQLCW